MLQKTVNDGLQPYHFIGPGCKYSCDQRVHPVRFIAVMTFLTLLSQHMF